MKFKEEIKSFFKQSTKNIIEDIIFNSRWLLIPFLLKLMYSIVLLLYHFLMSDVVEHEYIMDTLESIDVVMISCLAKIVVTGSYHSFIDKNHNKDTDSVSSGILKVKLSTSIVGVASIHLLKIIISEHAVKSEYIYQQILVFSVLVIGALVVAVIDYLHCKYTH